MTDKPPSALTSPREKRLAAALRANLVRRKALSRALGSDDTAARQADLPAADSD